MLYINIKAIFNVWGLSLSTAPPVRKIIHSQSSTRAAFSSFSACPLNRSCSHPTNRPKNTISWAAITPYLKLIISPHSHKNSIFHHHSPSRQRELPPLSIREVCFLLLWLAQLFYISVSVCLCHYACLEWFDSRSSTYSSTTPYLRPASVEKQPYRSVSSKLLFMS